MDDLRAAIAAQPLWYHTLDLAPGVTTPGWFDVRPVVDRLPWPEVTGKRCLDIGTYDGFLAFELERRGAAEVVAVDIPGHEDWDWLPRDRARGPEYLAAVAGEKGRGFEVAAEALGSSVTRQLVSIYDVSPDAVGMFDVVVCGTLLLHLRDPFRALEAVASVCRGQFLSMEQIDLDLTIAHPRRPVLGLVSRDGQWLVANAAAHRAMLHTAGFDLVRSVRPFTIPYGPSHPSGDSGKREYLNRLLLNGPGIPSVAALTTPHT